MKTGGTYQLIEHVLTLIRTPSVNGRPWKAREIGQIFSEVKTMTTRQQFCVDTLEHLRDLLKNAEEDAFFRRMASLSLLAEPVVLAHDEDSRDHLEHAINVWLLGWYILNATDLFASAHDQWRPYGWDISSRFDQLNRSWLYAALFHDCAYAIESRRTRQRIEQRLLALLPDIDASLIDVKTIGSSISEKMLPLWTARQGWLDQRKVGSSTSSSVVKLSEMLENRLSEKLYTPMDHSAFGGLILWQEANQLEGQTNTKVYNSEFVECLRIAAVSVACHNFQYLIKTSTMSEHEDEWYQLDFYYEPVAALLHLCDELQEWSRERLDEAFLHGLGRRNWSFANTELTELRVFDAAGLNIDVAIQRQIHEKDRPVRRRIWFEQENRIDETRRQFTQLFRPVKRENNPFLLRLRARQTVDGLPCRNTLLLRWSERIPTRLLAEHQEWVQKGKKVIKSLNGKLKEAKLTSPDKTLTLQLDNLGVSGSLLAGNAFKAIILGAGATGKSTILMHLGLARSKATWIKQYKPFYIEELPDLPLALDHEIDAFIGETKPGKIPLVLIDHLDRTLDSNFGAFWLSRLAELGQDRRVAIIIACRHEEYERFAAIGLQPHYIGIRFDSEVNRLTPHATGVGQARANPSELEELFHGIEAQTRDTLCSLALQAGRQRTLSVPGDEIFAGLKTTIELSAQPSFVITTRDGHLRFRHDCYQDVIAATGLAKQLCQSNQPGAIVANLVTLPPEVFRMLVGLLLDQKDRPLLTSKERHAARLKLFEGLLDAPTVQQFLYDGGRATRAFLELKALSEKHWEPPLAQAVLEKLVGHVHYQLFNWLDLTGSDDAKLKARSEAISTLRDLLSATDHLLKLQLKPGWDPQPIWVAAFILDHFLVVLSRVCNHNATWHEIRPLFDARISTVSSEYLNKPGSKTSKWLHGTISKVLGTVYGASNNEDVMGIKATIWEAMEALEQSIKKASTCLYDKYGERWLDVRLAHLVGHMGNFKIEQGNSLGVSKQLLAIARTKYEESIQIRDRVLRRMEQDYGYQSSIEVFSTKSLGYLDVANQYRGICQTWLEEMRGRVDQLAWAHFLEAYDSLYTTVQRARLNLQLNERHANVFRTILPILALGEVLKEVELSGTEPKKIIEHHCQKLFNEYTYMGERHERHQNDSWESVKMQVDDWFPHCVRYIPNMASG